VLAWRTCGARAMLAVCALLAPRLSRSTHAQLRTRNVELLHIANLSLWYTVQEDYTGIRTGVSNAAVGTPNDAAHVTHWIFLVSKYVTERQAKPVEFQAKGIN
jgi:hypothetical protein